MENELFVRHRNTWDNIKTDLKDRGLEVVVILHWAEVRYHCRALLIPQ
jgi:hypothetical protein